MSKFVVLLLSLAPVAITSIVQSRASPLHSSIKMAMVKPFKKDFTRPMAIPEEGITDAVKLMRSGRLFRYSAKSAETSHVAQAEREFGELVEHKYVVGVNSCSSAILLAMITCGVEAGDQVITNGFTFTALPSTIMRLNAKPVLVECTPSWTMDLDDLEIKASANPDAKVLLLSHMRGKITDMDRVGEICEKYGLTLIEDCAHSCGIKWDGRQQGYQAKVAAYSCQSDKVINAGEGGFVTTDDDEIAAKLIYLSGAYERRFDKHALHPPSEICEEMMMTMPNLSVRMSELTAAVMRPLIRNLESRVTEYNNRWDATVKVMESGAAGQNIVVPRNHERVRSVGDHLNFYLSNVTPEQNKVFAETCRGMGVPVASFVSPINARYHKNWRKFGAPAFDLPKTDEILAYGYDLKMPPYFEDSDFPHIGACIAYAVDVAMGRATEPRKDVVSDGGRGPTTSWAPQPQDQIPQIAFAFAPQLDGIESLNATQTKWDALY
jgi:dTDP-4-amino-4,6-dideoxygalactose transaminase